MPAPFVHMLDFDPPEVFTDAYRSDTESPSLIWNQSMRQTLRNHIMQYMNAFISQLRANPQTAYTYQEIPAIRYRGSLLSLSLSHSQWH